MNRTTISRRNALKKAATALGGGTAAILGGSSLSTQAPQIPGPRQMNTAGRAFRAFVRRDPLERMRDAVQEVAGRTVVAAVVVVFA